MTHLTVGVCGRQFRLCDRQRSELTLTVGPAFVSAVSAIDCLDCLARLLRESDERLRQAAEDFDRFSLLSRVTIDRRSELAALDRGRS